MQLPVSVPGIHAAPCVRLIGAGIHSCSSLLPATGIRAKVPFTISPGSEQIRATIERDGLLDVFNKIGGTVLSNRWVVMRLHWS